MTLEYSLHLAEQQRLPNQQEQRRALLKRTGDWMLVAQPSNKAFDATHQRHTRGIWTEAARKDLLKKVRATSNRPTAERKTALGALWKDNDMVWLRMPFAQIKRAVVRAQDLDRAPTGEVDRRTSKEFPGIARFLTLLAQDRIINRGNAHTELRSVAPGEDQLIGWTYFTPSIMFQFLRSGNLEEAGRNILLTFGDGKEIDRIAVTKKSPQPLVWLTLVTKQKPTFEAEAGKVGATQSTAGLFEFITGGGVPFRRVGRGRVGFSVVYGVRRSDFHEQFHFYEDPELARRIGGRWTFRLLDLKGDDDAPEVRRWLARRSDDPVPFIFKNDFKDESEQARKEKNDLIWNLPAVKELERLTYFKQHDIEKDLKEFEDSDRSKPPPRGGVVRGRPTGRPKTPPPDIIGD